MASPRPSDNQEGSCETCPCHTQDTTLDTECSFCKEVYTNPKVLDCFHTFCEGCLNHCLEADDKIKCPVCDYETTVPPSGLSGLTPDLAIQNAIESNVTAHSEILCTRCQTGLSVAVSQCLDCNGYFCPNCTLAHKVLNLFETHEIVELDLSNNEDVLQIDLRPTKCPKHQSEFLEFYCNVCDIPTCKHCMTLEHCGHTHGYIIEMGLELKDMLQQLGEHAKVKANDLRVSADNVEQTLEKIETEQRKAYNDINDTFNFFQKVLQDQQLCLIKELDRVNKTKHMNLRSAEKTMQEHIDILNRGSKFIENITTYCSLPEILLCKKMIDSKLQSAVHYWPSINNPNVSFLEFETNHQIIHAGVKNLYGHIRQSPDHPMPISRPRGWTSRSSTPETNGNQFDSYSQSSSAHFPSSSNISTQSNFSDNKLQTNGQRAWSLKGASSYQNLRSFDGDSFTEMTSKQISANIYPPRSDVKRDKMIYNDKFGEFGVLGGQFTEPSGVAVNAQNDIIVADTNNHRIQIFNREGTFKFKFGESGKRDGQLLYPNRVAVVRTSGDIIVTERSPTHQVQIYNQYGEFIRKFGANTLQHPRGVTVDSKGRIIIVECKVMRVIIFDLFGNILRKFGCSKHLEFPNGVVVNDHEEIFISDNRAHCVKVFNYEGEYLKQIGGEGITNYPIGVGINNTGEILIADNHNNFNVTIFKQDGTMVSALESKVKHAQCYDVALMDNGSIVLASKDYRLYVYRYLQSNASHN